MPFLWRTFCKSCFVFGNFVHRQNYVRFNHDFINHIQSTCSKLSFHTASCSQKRHKTREEKHNEQFAKIAKYDFTSKRKRKQAVGVWKNMTVAELAKAMDKDTDFVFEIMTFVDDSVYYTEPESVISDWNVLCDIVNKADFRVQIVPRPKEERVTDVDRDVFRRPPADPDKLVKRPPVVTVMGHVDHGKTTLLDSLRNTSVVSGEFGGITQHIGAFSVKVKGGQITFLDTPGHAAFSAMRSRGANCTDIVILVVAAEDGVMEQTVESIKMARDAEVPIIVAINKIDKPEADIEKTKKMLMMQNIVVEDLGGDIQAVPISALKGTNLDLLIEAVLVQAELAGLAADPSGFVEGIIIESKVDPHRGKLSTVLVQRGTLRRGCILTAGLGWAKVRGMFDDKQRQVSEAAPSTPVEIIGWRELPMPGDIIIEVESEKRAHEAMRFRQKKSEEEKTKELLPVFQEKLSEARKEYKAKLSEKRRLGTVYRKKRTGPREKEIPIEENQAPRLNVLIKGDVEGSIEAVLDMLDSYNSKLCQLDVIHYGVGHVSSNDIELAHSFNAVVYNFNIGCLPDAKSLANKKNVQIKPHNVIYRLMEDIKSEINKRIPPKDAEDILGEATVVELFLITEGKKKNIPIAGCRCSFGELKRSSLYKVIRKGEVIHTGTLAAMKHLKTEVSSVKKEQDCGLRFVDDPIIFESGDVIQSVRPYKVPQTVNWNPF